MSGRVFLGDAPEAVYQLMLELDRHDDLDEHPIRQSEAYQTASKGLGWDIDWDRVAEERMERGA